MEGKHEMYEMLGVKRAKLSDGVVMFSLTAWSPSVCAW